MKFHQFFSSVGIYSIANIIERIIPVVLIPVLTRLLTVEDFGIVTTIMAIRITIDPVLSLSTPAAVGRAYYDKDEYGFDFREYIFNALILHLLLLVLVIALILICRPIVPLLEKFSLFWVLFVVFIVFSSATGAIKVKLWVYQKNAKAFGIFKILKTLTNLTLSIAIVVFILPSWEGRLWGIGIAEFLFGIFSIYILIHAEGITKQVNGNYIKDILKFGLPLLPHAIGLTIISTSDKYFISTMCGLSEVGLYGIAYSIGTAIIMISTPVDLSAEPYIYNALKKNDALELSKVVRLVYSYFCLILLMALSLWIIAPFILHILVDSKFYPAEKFVFWISLGFAFYAMRRIMNKFITFSKKNRLISQATITSGLVSIPAYFLLIKNFGPIGASQAFFLTYFIAFVITWYEVTTLYSINWFPFRPANSLIEK